MSVLQILETEAVSNHAVCVWDWNGTIVAAGPQVAEEEWVAALVR